MGIFFGSKAPWGGCGVALRQPPTHRLVLDVSTVYGSVHFIHPVSENREILSIGSIVSIVSMVFAPKLHPK